MAMGSPGSAFVCTFTLGERPGVKPPLRGAPRPSSGLPPKAASLSPALASGAVPAEFSSQLAIDAVVRSPNRTLLLVSGGERA
jgi:hypothetical protein